MTADMIDVEPLLAEYDHGVILVGPLLSLSINSCYRYFYVAGKGSKIYQSLALGFVDIEANAQRQRADFIEKLAGRFAEVMTFASHLEMAHAVHTYWPNEETARLLAFTKLEANAEPTTAASPESNDSSDHADVQPGDFDKQRIVEAAEELADDSPSTPDRGHPTPVLEPPLTFVPPSSPIATLIRPHIADGAVARQRQHSTLGDDDFASAILKLKSPPDLAHVPRPEVLARRLVWPALRYLAVGAAAATIAWVIARPNTRQVAPGAVSTPVPASSILAGRNKDSSQLPTAVASSQVTKAIEPAPQAEPTRSQFTVVSEPPPQAEPTRSQFTEASEPPPQAEPTRSQFTEASEPPPQAEPTRSQFTEASEPAPQAEPTRSQFTEASEPAPQAEPTRSQFTEASEPAPQAEPTQSQSTEVSEPAPQAEPTRSQFAEASEPVPQAEPTRSQLTEASEAAPQAEPTHDTVPPSPPPQTSQVANTQVEDPPVSALRSPPAHEGGPVVHLDADEIATLISRGADFLKNGDVLSARLLFQRAAAAGSASAALSLGKTFDPLLIQQLGAFGPVPDIAQARQWYEIAAKLGSDAASQRLAQLAQTGH